MAIGLSMLGKKGVVNQDHYRIIALVSTFQSVIVSQLPDDSSSNLKVQMFIQDRRLAPP